MMYTRVLLLACYVAVITAEPCQDGRLEASGEDCSKFRSCIGGNWLDLNCSPKQVFDPSKELCVGSGEYNCTFRRVFDICLDEGRRFPVDGCTLYDECQSGKLVRKVCGGLFKQFSPKQGRCVFVWPWKSCKPLANTKCENGNSCEFDNAEVAAEMKTTPITRSKTTEAASTPKLSTETTSQVTTILASTTEEPTTAEPKCLKGDRKPDKETCRKYSECNDEGKWISKSCFWFWNFDQKSLKCKFWHSHCAVNLKKN